MNAPGLTRWAVLLGIFALLLSVVALAIRYSKTRGVDWIHVVAALALLFFVVVIARNRGNR